jgi:hypothetical protein
MRPRMDFTSPSMISRQHTSSIVVLTLALSAAACSSSPSSPLSSAGAGGANVGGGGSAGIAGSAGTAAGGASAGASASSGGASGSAGAATGGVGAVAGAGGATAGAAGAAGTAGAAGAGTAGAAGTGCPTGALFCADFEEASGPPTGATFEAPDENGGTFATLMKLDTTAPFAGKQSLAVTSAGGFQIRMLGVPTPSSAFWVRLFIKSDQALGEPNHNSFFAAMTDPNYHNSTATVELAAQYSCLLLNKSDSLFPAGNTCTVNTALSANTWHCMEAHYDGAAGNVTVFADKTKIIDAVAWAPAMANFNTFDFGYASYNMPARTVWYDNVSITTTQVGCP